MITLGSIIAFCITLFYVVDYYHKHKEDSDFEPGFFGLVSAIILIIVTATSWLAVLSFAAVKSADYLYKKYYLKKDQ